MRRTNVTARSRRPLMACTRSVTTFASSSSRRPADGILSNDGKIERAARVHCESVVDQHCFHKAANQGIPSRNM